MSEEQPSSGSEGGDAPCWMDRICTRCGAFIEGARCWRCGAAPGPAADEPAPQWSGDVGGPAAAHVTGGR